MLTNYKSTLFFHQETKWTDFVIKKFNGSIFHFVFDCGNSNAVFKGAFIALFDSLTICQYYQLSEYVIVSEIFVNIPNVILSNVIPKELSYI